MIVMVGDYKNTTQLKITLEDHEKILLQRYIDAERQEPDFIARGLSNLFTKEIFVYFYFAGHGCSDNMQKFLLNEKEVKKIFWSAEENIKMVLGSGGSNCKAFVVFDCCREDFVDLRDRVQLAIESQKNIATQQN